MNNIERADVAGANVGAIRGEGLPTVAAAQAFRAETRASDPDCAESDALRKRQRTTQARAALLGIEVRPIAPDAWLLRHASGADIGIVRGLPALDEAVAGFEAAHRDVAELVQRMRGVRHG